MNPFRGNCPIFHFVRGLKIVPIKRRVVDEPGARLVTFGWEEAAEVSEARAGQPSP